MKAILIIDDEVDFLEGFGSLLADADYKVRTATSAQAGIEELRKECPDLVLLDLMMPGMKGFEALRFVRTSKDICDTPVVLMSASREPQTDDLKWDAFLSKPFDIDEALRVIASLLRAPHCK